MADFETLLLPEEEAAFAKWMKLFAPQDSGEDYDFRGAFKAGYKPGTDGHWPDTFKKPNHPTFSIESIYALDRPQLAGRWKGEQYIPPGVGQSLLPLERALRESQQMQNSLLPILGHPFRTK
jgi:hypothetical protein